VATSKRNQNMLQQIVGGDLNRISMASWEKVLPDFSW
jgi:hypothetical protein